MLIWIFRNNQIFYNLQQKHNNYLSVMINKFKDFIGPDMAYNENDDNTHKELLQLINKKYLSLFYEKADDKDRARIKSLSVNGALSWMNIALNNNYGVKCSNLEFYVLLSLIFGCELIKNKSICKKCKKLIDNYGHHGLHFK